MPHLSLENMTARASILTSASYTPTRLLNHLEEELGVTNYEGIAHALNVHVNTIKKVATKKSLLESNVIVGILDALPHMTIRDVRRLAGLPIYPRVLRPKAR